MFPLNESLKPVYSTMYFLFPVSCLLLFFTSCLFASYPFFCFISSEIKINELRKKYIVKNTIVDKTVVKKKKAKNKKQEIGNKEHIVE